MNYGSLTLTRSRIDIDVRYLLGKIQTDLRQLRLLHNLFSLSYENGKIEDLFHWIYSGYAKAIELIVFNPSNNIRHFSIRYDIYRDGTFSSNDEAGSVPYDYDLSVYEFDIIVITNETWKGLTGQEKRNFYRRLSPGWGPSSLQLLEDNGAWTFDKTYSRNQLSAKRSTYRRYQ